MFFFCPKYANDAAGRGQHHSNHVNSRRIILCLQPNLTLVFSSGPQLLTHVGIVSTNHEHMILWELFEHAQILVIFAG